MFLQFISLGFVSFLLAFTFGVCIFFIIREITLWYFKINENTESMKSIENSLRKISIAAEFFTTDLLERHNSKIVTEKPTNKINTEEKEE